MLLLITLLIGNANEGDNIMMMMMMMIIIIIIIIERHMDSK